MKRYTFELVIEEGCDEFWDQVANQHFEGGAKLVEEEILNALQDYGFLDCQIKLRKFEYKNELGD